MTFGEFAANLRRSRGLTQSDLAARTECDQETIAKVEQNRRGMWRPSLAMRIYTALSEVLPFTAEEAEQFSKATGLRIPRPVNPAIAAIPPAAAPPTPERQVAAALLDRLLMRHGALRIETLLRDLLALTQETASAPPMIVKHPPIQREGYIEQVEVEYAPPPAPIKPKAQKRHG